MNLLKENTENTPIKETNMYEPKQISIRQYLNTNSTREILESKIVQIEVNKLKKEIPKKEQQKEPKKLSINTRNKNKLTSTTSNINTRVQKTTNYETITSNSTTTSKKMNHFKPKVEMVTNKPISKLKNISLHKSSSSMNSQMSYYSCKTPSAVMNKMIITKPQSRNVTPNRNSVLKK